MTSIIFVCTGNSCRSQMAEGWARHYARDARDAREVTIPELSVASAGIEAHGLNPKAVQVMAEAGVDISTQTSDTLAAYDLGSFSIVVTVCGHADEHCPVLPAGVRKEHWPLEDPAKFEGTDAEVESGFRAVRDDIASRVKTLLSNL